MKNEIKHLLKKIINKEDPVILDIGANIGSYSSVFLDNFKNVFLFCFEPDPRVLKEFRKRTKKDKRCILYKYAISDKNEKKYLYLSSSNKKGVPGSYCSSSIRVPYKILSYFPLLKFKKKILVKTMTLDSWFEKQDINYIDLIWCDIQGCEGDMIKGGINTLKKTKYLFTEYGEKEWYKGQFLLKDILEALPFFEIVKKYPFPSLGTGDILLKNILFNKESKK